MNFLYTLFIFPIEFIYKYIYLFCTMATNSYGIGLFVLSIISSIAFLPLARFALSCQAKENEFHAVVAPQMKAIKENFSGKERNDAINRLYQRYAYHPIMGIRSAFGVLLQVPFLTGAYYMISSLEEIKGHSFLCIPDLSQPDGLLFGLNLLPILMTIVNVGVVFTTKGLQRKDIIQALVIAAFFLVLLYPAPSALLIFWTTNNILFLLGNFIPQKKQKGRFFTFLSQNINKTLSKPKFLLNSATLFLPLVLFLPVYFLVVQNLHMFKLSDVYQTSAFIFVLCLGFALLGFIFDMLTAMLPKYTFFVKLPRFLVKHNSFLRNKFLITLSCNTLIYFVVVFLAMYILKKYIVDIDVYIPKKIPISYVLGAVFVLTSAIIYKFNYRPVNLFLVMFIAITTCKLPVALLDYHDISLNSLLSIEKNDYQYSDNPIIENAFKQFPMEEKLKNKPNIYLFLLESHHDFEMQKNVFGIDTAPMEKSLTDAGFTIYNGVFSNAPVTTGSLLSLNIMQPDYSSFARGAGDVSSSIYDIYSGSSNNPLFSYLKKQGYHIASYLPPYFIRNKGVLLDYALAIDGYAQNPLENVLSIIMPNFFSEFFPQNLKAAKAYQYINLQHSFESTEPVFSTIYCDWLHGSATEDKIYKNYRSFIQGEKYKLHMPMANNEISYYIDCINKNDPNAVVIFVGDHGYRYGIHADISTIPKRYTLSSSELSQDLRLGMSELEVAQDTFGTLLAVKMPKKSIEDITFGKVISHANIFRHIFAALDNNQIYLDSRVENISYAYNSSKVSIKDGIVQSASAHAYEDIIAKERAELKAEQEQKKQNFLTAIKNNVSMVTISEKNFLQIQVRNCASEVMTSQIVALNSDPMLILPNTTADKNGTIIFAAKMTASDMDNAQLFYAPVGQNFSEAQSKTQTILKGENFIYITIKAEPGQVMQLRFDPGRTVSTYTFHELE